MNKTAIHRHAAAGAFPGAAVLHLLASVCLAGLLLTAGSGWAYPVVPVDRAPVPGAVRAARLPDGAVMRFVWVESRSAGRDHLAAAPGVDGRDAERAVLAQGFLLGQSAVTVRQWQAVMGSAPVAGAGCVAGAGGQPVVRVSWQQVQAFVAALNQDAGREVYRLPTAVEWEYACRDAVTRPQGGGEDSRLGQFALDHRGDSVADPAAANPWGLVGMAGDPEWVQNGSGCRRCGGGEQRPVDRVYGTATAGDQVVCTGTQAPLRCTAPSAAPGSGGDLVALGARLVWVP